MILIYVVVRFQVAMNNRDCFGFFTNIFVSVVMV